MLLVVALGGNALLRRGEPPEADIQLANARAAALPLAELARDHELVITHGNGPQVGLLALQSESLDDVPSYPLDILDAESEGMLGYLIEQELANLVPKREVATLLTRVEVAADDPAFAAPSKPIGPVYEKGRARELARERDWKLAPDGGGYRRVVASPLPRRILELATIRLLVDAGHIVLCAGGGGIPVAVDSMGRMRGIEAVIDKDRASCLLARELRADKLLLLTDEPAVWSAWPRERGLPIQSASPESLEAFNFDPGSMGPKVEAACEFVTTTGKTAIIGALGDAVSVTAGTAGTSIHPVGPLRLYRSEDHLHDRH